MYTRRMALGRLRLGFFASPAAIFEIQFDQYSPDKNTKRGRLTATISVPRKEKAAWVKTAQKPRKRPFAPAMPLYWTNGPGFFQ